MNNLRLGNQTLFVRLTGAPSSLNFQLLPVDEKQKEIKCQRNTRLKPYTTRMAKIQGLDEGITYSNIYKDKRAHT